MASAGHAWRCTSSRPHLLPAHSPCASLSNRPECRQCNYRFANYTAAILGRNTPRELCRELRREECGRGFMGSKVRSTGGMAGSRQLHGGRSRFLLPGAGSIDPGGERCLPGLRSARGLSGVRPCQLGEVRHLGRHERAGAPAASSGSHCRGDGDVRWGDLGLSSSVLHTDPESSRNLGVRGR